MIILFLITFFLVINVNALDVSIDSISIKDKSDKTLVGNIDMNNLTITPNIEFSEVGESVTYEIKLKNNSKNKYWIKEIKDNNTSGFVKTSYKTGNSINDPIYVTFRYDKKTNNLAVSDINIMIETAKITSLATLTNPKTGQIISIIFLVIALLLLGLYTIIGMKKKQKSILVLIVALVLTAFISTKAKDGVTITIKGNNISIKKLEFVAVNKIDENNISIGDEYCFGEECFYVAIDDPEYITLLTKNILYAGALLFDDGFTQEIIPSDSEDYCLQKKSTNEYKDGDGFSVGTIAFATDNYWMDKNTGRLKNKYGYEEPLFPWEDTEIYDPDYQGEPMLNDDVGYPGVSNDNYSIAFYVEQYVQNLREMGIENIEGGLLSYQDVYRLGCSESGCTNAPAWLYSSAYWLSSASGRTGVWGVASFGKVAAADCDRNVGFGIRPTITIPVEYLNNN